MLVSVYDKLPHGLVMEAAMKFFARRKFRKHVLTAIGFLTGDLSLSFQRRLLKAYPGIVKAMDEAFYNCEASEKVAVRIAAMVYSSIIELMPYNRRQNCLSQIQANVPTADADPVVRTIRGMVNTAEIWARGRNLDESDCDILVSELLGALAGKSAQERSVDRILVPLVRASNL